MPKPSITVTTSCRLELKLQPVPMLIMPSSNSEAWLAFTKRGEATYSFPLALDDVARIQEFMLENSTECLSDGNRNYTVYGRALVGCHPDAISREMVRRYELA